MKKLLTIITFLSASLAMGKIVYPTPQANDILLEISKGHVKALNPESIKLLVWNLHKGGDPDFEKDYRLLSKGKDILINQEMYLNPLMTGVFTSLKQFGFKTATSFFDPTTANPMIRTGVATGSTVEPISVEYVKTQNLEPVINSPKVTLITRYPIAGTNKILTVANIHSINFVSADVFRQELDRIYQVLKTYPKPIIFAGDFNTWLGEKIYYLDQMRIALNLKEAVYSPDNRMNKNGYYLDHVLYSDDLTQVFGQSLGKYLGSDHKPLEVEFQFDSNSY